MVQVFFFFIPSRFSLHSSQSSTSNPRKMADDVGSSPHLHSITLSFMILYSNNHEYYNLLLPSREQRSGCASQRMFQGLPYWCHIVYSGPFPLSLCLSFSCAKNTRHRHRTLAQARTLLTMVRTTWLRKGETRLKWEFNFISILIQKTIENIEICIKNALKNK